MCLQELCACFFTFNSEFDKNIPVWGDIVCFLAMFTPYIGMILFGIGLFSRSDSGSENNDEADK